MDGLNQFVIIDESDDNASAHRYVCTNSKKRPDQTIQNRPKFKTNIKSDFEQQRMKTTVLKKKSKFITW
jgi:hypothetical protein